MSSAVLLSLVGVSVCLGLGLEDPFPVLMGTLTYDSAAVPPSAAVDPRRVVGLLHAHEVRGFLGSVAVAVCVALPQTSEVEQSWRCSLVFAGSCVVRGCKFRGKLC
jgi:hypothetical protein